MGAHFSTCSPNGANSLWQKNKLLNEPLEADPCSKLILIWLLPLELESWAKSCHKITFLWSTDPCFSARKSHHCILSFKANIDMALTTWAWIISQIMPQNYLLLWSTDPRFSARKVITASFSELQLFTMCFKSNKVKCLESWIYNMYPTSCSTSCECKKCLLLLSKLPFFLWKLDLIASFASFALVCPWVTARSVCPLPHVLPSATSSQTVRKTCNKDVHKQDKTSFANSNHPPEKIYWIQLYSLRILFHLEIVVCFSV